MTCILLEVKRYTAYCGGEVSARRGFLKACKCEAAPYVVASIFTPQMRLELLLPNGGQTHGYNRRGVGCKKLEMVLLDTNW